MTVLWRIGWALLLVVSTVVVYALLVIVGR
jgi:hypothetical protein